MMSMFFQNNPFCDVQSLHISLSHLLPKHILGDLRVLASLLLTLDAQVSLSPSTQGQY